MKLVVLGLSITSSWGNGHATTYRALLSAFAARGHDITFLERDVPWYASHRDLPDPAFCRTHLYGSLDELQRNYGAVVAAADVVLVGSYVPDAINVAEWVFATARGLVCFYDIDTPITLAALTRGEPEYVTHEQITRYDVYFSFTGGPTLRRLEQLGSPCARALYCSVDTALYFPEPRPKRWDLGYMGTYSIDRQPALERLLIEPARQWSGGRFVVAGPQYPAALSWPPNVERIPHLPPQHHRYFYNTQHYTLNITRADMVASGYAPSVRLFEAAACATPIISDHWDGLETFFEIGSEIIVVNSTEDAVHAMRDAEAARSRDIGPAARRRVLAHHSSERRAHELESYLAGIPLAHSV